MGLWAHVSGGLIVETTSVSPAGRFAPGLTWVEIDGISPEPTIGWAGTETGGTWAFSAPAQVTPTPAQQAAAALASGLAVTCTSEADLSATYGTSATWQQRMLATQAQANAMAAGLLSGTTVLYPDVTGTSHTFTLAKFSELAVAVFGYVTAVDLYGEGLGTTLPPATATIA